MQQVNETTTAMLMLILAITIRPAPSHERKTVVDALLIKGRYTDISCNAAHTLTTVRVA